MVIKLSNTLQQYILQLHVGIKTTLLLVLASIQMPIAFAEVEYADANLVKLHNKEVERTYENVKMLQNKYSGVEGKLEILKAELADLKEEENKLTTLYDKFWNAAKHGEAKMIEKANQTSIRKTKANKAVIAKTAEVAQVSRQVLENKQTIEKAIAENNKAQSKEKITFELVVSRQLSIELTKIETPVSVKLSAVAICSKMESLITCADRVKRLAEKRAMDRGAQKAVNTMTEVRNFQLEKDSIVNSINAKLSNEIILKSELIKASPLTYEVELSVDVAPVRSSLIKSEIRKSIITELSAYRFIGSDF